MRWRNQRFGSLKCLRDSEIQEFREQTREIKNRVQQDQILTEEAKSILYSNWYYLAIWSLAAIPDFQNFDSLVERLKINKKKAREALEFLKKYVLVIEDENGNLKNGPTLVHLPLSLSSAAWDALFSGDVHSKFMSVEKLFDAEIYKFGQIKLGAVRAVRNFLKFAIDN